MPPKKAKTRAAAGLSKPGPDLSWVGSEPLDPKEITNEHRQRALGLTSARRCIVPCLEKWKASEAGNKRAECVEEEVEVVQVDEDSDAQGAEARTGSKRTRPRVEYVRRQTLVAPKKCVKKNCMSNVYCYNHLGLEEWFAPDAEAKYLQANGLGPDPSNDMRSPDTLVGLRNLGATCYANAFLQIWYANEAMRSAVYKCAAAMPTAANDSPIYQLALTFAAMQLSVKAYHDPTGLVESLQLKKGDQQDASEFSKLFMSLIGDELEKGDDEALKTVIDDEFGGKLKYTTRCITCGFVSTRTEKFLELELSMNATKSKLEDCLAALFAEETLDGDNKYLCGRCESLQPATRRASLDTLPPTLQVSVLRFVYDPATFTRKKSRTALQFPAKIDMARYGVKDTAYTLQGVVEHIGPSAHRGHFTCKVHNADLDKWFLCDDESTKRLTRPLTQASELEPDDVISIASDSRREESVPPVHKRNGKPRSGGESKDSCVVVSGGSDSSTKVVTQTSTNVYMLVYKQDRAISSGDASKAWPSDSLKEMMNAQNTAINAEQADYRRRESALKEAYVRDKAAVVEAFVAIADLPDPVSSTMVYVSREDLVVMLRLDKRKNAGAVGPIQKNCFMALPVQQPPTEPKVENGGHVKATTVDHRRAGDLHGGAITEPLAGDRQSRVSLDLDQSAMLTPADKAESSRTTPYQVETASPEPLSEAVVPEKVLTITCCHGGLSPIAGGNLRAVSQNAMDAMRLAGFTSSGETYQFNRFCDSCLQDIVSARASTEKHQKSVERISTLLKNADDECDHVLAQPWWQAWKDRAGRLPAMPEQIADMIKMISCPHDKVLPHGLWNDDCVAFTGEAIQALRESNPGVTIPVRSLMEEACQECATTAEKIYGDTGQMKTQAAHERRHLKGIRYDGLPDRPRIPDYGKDYYMLDTHFAIQWTAFVDEPKRNPRPKLSNDRLVCEHGLLNIDPNFNPDLRGDQVRLLLPEAWFHLVSLYGDVDHAITFKRLSATFAEASIETCKPCWNTRRSELAEYEIWALLLETDDPVTGPPPTESEDQDADQPERMAKSGSRTSNRLAAQRKGTARRNTWRLEVKREDTMKALREHVGKKLGVPPFYLAMFFNGKDIGDIDQTMRDVGVSPDDTVFVRNVADRQTDSDGPEDEPVPNRVDGFGGTLLGRSSLNTKVEQPAVQEDPPAAAQEKIAKEGMHCMQCTFISAPAATVCAVCESPFP